MNAKIIDKRFYEKKWMSIGEWENQKSPYLKKNPGIEAFIALKWVKKYLKSGKLLDVGCGGGRNSILFSKNGFQATGIDFSKKAIKLANILKKEEKCNADFIEKSILDEFSEENFFDLIIDFGCFHHLRKNQWNKYLKNVKKLLKPKSYYLLYCFSKESKETINYKKGKDYSYKNHHYNHYFSLTDLNNVFKKNFSIIKHKIIKEKNRLLAFNMLLMQKNN